MTQSPVKFAFVVLSLLYSSVLFAQEAAIENKLNQLKAKDDFSNWIYDRLDYVNENPSKRLAYLMASQKAAWRTANTPEERFAWLNLLNTQGYSQLIVGNILGAIQQYEAAFSYYLKYKVNDYNIVEYTLKPLSNNYTRLGDYERALYLQQLSIKYQTQFDNNPNEIAAILCNMAISYRSMGNLAAAKTQIQKGYALKPDAPTLVMLNNIYADILYDQEQYLEAKKIISLSIKHQKSVDKETAYWLMSAHTTAGNIATAQQQLAAAKNNYEIALTLLQKFYPDGRTREKANLYTQLGKVALLQNKAVVAIDQFNKTLSILGIANEGNEVIVKNIYGDNKLVDVFLQLANAHLQLKDQTKALTNTNLSLLSADKIRTEFADDKTKQRLQSDLKKIVEKGISLCYDLFQKTKNADYLKQILILTEQSKSRTLLDQMERNTRFISKNLQSDSLFIKKQYLERNIVFQEKQAIDDKNYQADQSIAALKFDLALMNKAIAKKYKQVDLKNLDPEIDLKNLPLHRLITYFVGEENVYVININQRRIEQVLKLENAPKIKENIKIFVRTYFQNGATAMLNNPKSFYGKANNIYKLIVQPLRIKSNETITIIPDGILGYLSFDGLITTSTYTANIAAWPFFIKQYQTNYAFSLKTLQFKQAKKKKNNFTGLFITHEESGKAALKAVAEEAEEIRKYVTGEFLFNDEVTIKNFNKQFIKSDILHIGTHAYLSGPDQEPTLDFGKEKIYLFELAAKETVPSLVVLSACRTADGVLADGEGIISFSRGFNAIGTTATVASLWNANDNTVAQITALFYKNLGEGKSSTEALREAKLAWLNSASTPNAMLLPYYWDNLVYMGTDQKFELAKPSATKAIVVGLLGLVLLSGLAYKLRMQFKTKP